MGSEKIFGKLWRQDNETGLGKMIVCHIPEANREKVVPEVTTALQKKYEKMLQNISLLPEYTDIVWIQDP